MLILFFKQLIKCTEKKLSHSTTLKYSKKIPYDRPIHNKMLGWFCDYFEIPPLAPKLF